MRVRVRDRLRGEGPGVRREGEGSHVMSVPVNLTHTIPVLANRSRSHTIPVSANHTRSHILIPANH